MTDVDTKDTKPTTDRSQAHNSTYEKAANDLITEGQDNIIDKNNVYTMQDQI